MKSIKRIPADPKRCQTERVATFMTLGAVPGTLLGRCDNVPMVIAYERRKGPDGLKGSMSMCAEHLKEFRKSYAGDKLARFVPIKRGSNE